MLLNEFLKEHRKVNEQERKAQQQEARLAKQEATIAQQQKQIEALTASTEGERKAGINESCTAASNQSLVVRF
jgi:hypothetical protein